MGGEQGVVTGPHLRNVTPNDRTNHLLVENTYMPCFLALEDEAILAGRLGLAVDRRWQAFRTVGR